MLSLNIAVLTISDTRVVANDKSGAKLIEFVKSAKHNCLDYKICKDNIYQIRAIVSNWIADSKINVILLTGGTGFAKTDVTIAAITPLFDKQINGFGELFRQLSIAEIGCSTIQSNASAGMANRTLLFAMPGSTSACQLAWSAIIEKQLDSEFKPCNFTAHLCH